MLLALATFTLSSLQAQELWPRVAELDTLFVIADATHPHVKTFIRSPSGKPLYLFICRQGDDPEAPGDINYSGDLDCRLMPAELREVEENLLVEDHKVAAWYSRGRMFAQHLRGACADYPEYGLVRHFRLRGMRITMRFTHALFSEQRELRSYQLQVAVVNDPTARRDIAAISGYLDPGRQVPNHPRSCSVVVRGNEWR
jgi:hypothetical protein